MTTTTKPNTFTFAGFQCDVVVKAYHNGVPALQLVDANDGMPIATASVNLPGSVPGETIPYNHTYIKDYSENAGILDALVEAGIVRDTGGVAIAGFELVDLVEILI